MVKGNKLKYDLKKSILSEGNAPSNTATFWKRAMAFVFDLLVINLIIAWPFQSTLQQYAMKEFSLNATLPAEAYLIVFMMFLLALLYFAFLEYYIGQTPGQMLVNIKSVSNDNNMTFWKAVLRNIFILPFFPFYIFWILEPIHLIFYKQRLLERWTNTNTVTVEKFDYTKYKLKKVE